MALSYKARRRLSLLALLVWLPLYIIVAVNVVELFERPPILVELLIFAALGVLWALPLRRIFLGVGREDPDAGDKTG
ncbi:MAG: DUF2842 domain-containing protein [Pseudomonadota bacterium]